MENLKIQNIITKKLLKEASSEELLVLNKWREESPDNEQLYQEYSAIWEASAHYKPIDFQSKAETAYQKHIDLLAKEKMDNVIPFQESKDNNGQKKSSTKIFTLQRVASIAALFVIVFGAMFVFNSVNTTKITSSDGVTFASLEDGSSIWLDQGSSVTYTSGFGEYHRDLKLEGKAFFDVKRNKDIEFSISANDMNVTVLGTSFTVDSKSGSNSVAVKTGKVAVELNEKRITLLPNEKMIEVEDDLQFGVASIEDINWRNKDLSFYNARLDQVISDINLFHDDKLVLKSDFKDLSCPFTSKSLLETPFENIIEILKITYDLQIEQNPSDGTFILTISECK